MKPFLSYVAKDLYQKYGNNLAHLAVVFPNKRAALFLNQELAKMANGPIWSPSYITISELFRDSSSLSIANPIKSICLLHKVYTDITESNESLDHFFGWGQLLLADFDDIDKNMADASMLFRNVRDLHELDSIDYLDDEQKNLIMRFFGNFTGEESELKKKFICLWSNLHQIYTQYRHRLSQEGLAYEGMLYRNVVEQGETELPMERYIFIGFNVLQKVEQRLFEKLRQQGKADFYWDYDYYFTHRVEHEAGAYIRQWPYKFPNALNDEDEEIYNQLSQNKEINFISAPTENLQARYVSTWLREHARYNDGKRTAIVMCDEKLLPIVIHSVPPETESINVTTGYPLQQTPIASFVTQLLRLQIDGFSTKEQQFRLNYVERILRHPYTQLLSPNANPLLAKIISHKQFYITREELSTDERLRKVFRQLPIGALNEIDALALTEWVTEIIQDVAVCGAEKRDPLFQESVFRMYTVIQQLSQLIACGDLNADLVILQRLISQLVNATSVPFHGEPAQGVQIMGVLETRNLDFDHVLLLSCNEGNMPKGVDDASFIPHALRSAYGLTTIDNKVAIYSYYFHSLLQRAKDISILYNSSTEGIRTGEMSRFMLQLMVEWPHRINKFTLQAGQEPMTRSITSVEKDKRIMKVLHAYKTLSPTALMTYLRCQLRFFYGYVAKLYEQEDLDANTFDAMAFGNIFHRAAELLYEKLLPKERIERADIEQLIKQCQKNNSPLEAIISQSIAEQYFHLAEGTISHPALNGIQLLSQEVIKKYLLRLLETDLSVAPLRIIAHEASAFTSLSSTSESPVYSISVGGRIDRIDEIRLGSSKQQIRVVDYKTGNSVAKPLKEIAEVFMPTKITSSHSDYQLQVMIYSLLVGEDTLLNPNHKPVSPALLFIQHTSAEDYSPILSLNGQRINNMAEHKDEFSKRLHLLLDEIFNPEIPFTPTADLSACRYCPFKALCNKN